MSKFIFSFPLGIVTIIRQSFVVADQFGAHFIFLHLFINESRGKMFKTLIVIVFVALSVEFIDNQSITEDQFTAPVPMAENIDENELICCEEMLFGYSTGIHSSGIHFDILRVLRGVRVRSGELE